MVHVTVILLALVMSLKNVPWSMVEVEVALLQYRVIP